MVLFVWQLFAAKWLERAKRFNVPVDDGDRFISLWVAFNGWMRGQFGENLSDGRLLRAAKKFPKLTAVFIDLKSNDIAFQSNLNILRTYPIYNMKYPDVDPTTYDGTLASLLQVIYNVRCNLFHGRKNVDEDTKDQTVVSLSYKILLPLFEAFLKRRD